MICPPLFEFVPNDGNRNQRDEGCYQFNSLVIQRLTSLKDRKESFVVLAGDWALRPVFPVGGTSATAQADYGEQIKADHLISFERAIDATLDKLGSLQLPAIVFLQPPKQKYPSPSCIQRLGAARCMVPVQGQLDKAGPVNGAIRRAVARHRNALVFDPFDVLCNSENCPALLDDHIAYYDERHITATVAKSDRVAGALQPLLDRAKNVRKMGGL